jgi:hypothetical protein
MESEGSNIMGGGPRPEEQQEDGGKYAQSRRKTPSVHFSNEEPEQIPVPPLVSPSSEAGVVDVPKRQQRQQLDSLTDSLAASLQQQRLAHFDYQPFSLPPSRVSPLFYSPPGSFRYFACSSLPCCGFVLRAAPCVARITFVPVQRPRIRHLRGMLTDFN